MIRLINNQQSKPWRRRIPNQLAAVAAIMLFASTQVGAPERPFDDVAATSPVAARGVIADISGPQLELKATLDQARGEPAKKSSKSGKKRGFKLNLFRFRR